MPIYVYRNLETGETFEYEQRITESALTEHPETGDPVKRLIQPVGIAFKGSGFYINDSRKEGSSKAKPTNDASTSDAKSESKTESKSEGKSESKSDTKPAAKTETKTVSSSKD